VLVLAAFAFVLNAPIHRPEEIPPVDAELIEEPPPPPVRVPPVEKPRVRPAPAAKMKSTIQPRAPVPVVQTPTDSTPQTPAAHPEAAPSPETPPPPPVVQQPKAVRNATASSGARAIVKPMPQIPDDLRDEAFSTVALARFHIAADGTFTVELAKTTQNPRLNRLLLETLKNWRFFPATSNGIPVASTQDVVIKLEVH
jgi:protein TonB